MAAPTLEDAKALIERMKGIHPECDQCSVIAYDCHFHHESGAVPPIEGDAFNEGLGELVKKSLPEGYEHCSWKPALIKRCEKCASASAYPWANRLDVEKVLAHMESERGYAFDLSDLEKTL